MARKKESECKKAKCGLTTLSKCKKSNANLKECEGCKLVRRLSDRWKMIDRKPHKKCSGCGAFLPLGMYHRRTIRKPNGEEYEITQSLCKMCRSRMDKEAYRRKVHGLK